jgi:hypothetical protein
MSAAALDMTPSVWKANKHRSLEHTAGCNNTNILLHYGHDNTEKQLTAAK